VYSAACPLRLARLLYGLSGCAFYTICLLSIWRSQTGCQVHRRCFVESRLQSATIAFVYIPLIYCCTSSFDLFVFLPSLEFLPAIGIVGVISWRSWCRISYNPFCERDLWLHCFYCGMVNLIQSLLTLSFVCWFFFFSRI